MHLSQKEYQLLLQKSPSVREAAVAQSVLQKTQHSPTKYCNKKVYVYADGFVSEQKDVQGHGGAIMRFDSVRECSRYFELKLMERAKRIKELKRQVPIVIQEGFTYREEKVKPIVYVADFTYCLADGSFVVEDVKGIDKNGKRVNLTADFKLKWKLLKAKYPTYVFEIY